jgi:hypothetical protein
MICGARWPALSHSQMSMFLTSIMSGVSRGRFSATAVFMLSCMLDMSSRAMGPASMGFRPMTADILMSSVFAPFIGQRSSPNIRSREDSFLHRGKHYILPAEVPYRGYR